MEESLGKRIENVRRKIEEYGEKSYDKKYEDDWKKLLNELNDIKLKIYKNTKIMNTNNLTILFVKDICSRIFDRNKRNKPQESPSMGFGYARTPGA